VFLPGAGREEVAAWSERFRRELEPPGSYSAGIALFPCGDFKKAEMVLNARKALLHTRFLGPGSATIFDSVSLNISGDFYYEEGDLARAVREYRRGLVLDGGSVNLLNSLGVAYARMNRYRQAIPLFEQALAGEPGNFMALFNLGYAHLHFGETGRAVECFERALEADGKHFDLLLQLGRLYCQIGRFREAAALLARAEGLDADGRNGAGQGRVSSYLGQAHKGLGDHQHAIVYLQRAVQYNPRDAAAISLLGELYALEGQGDEIALSLCRQAVELDDSRSEHWCRLGLVQWLAGKGEEAEAAVRRSLSLERTNVAALRLLGEISCRQGRSARARQIWGRLLRLRPGDREAQKMLERLGSGHGGNGPKRVCC
jgi:tetratricopeptide (TPR) repeat protein